MSTPAVSAVIRKRKASTKQFLLVETLNHTYLFVALSSFEISKLFLLQANGGFIMSASHNPGGPDYDWGIKVRIYCTYRFKVNCFFSFINYI